MQVSGVHLRSFDPSAHFFRPIYPGPNPYDRILAPQPNSPQNLVPVIDFSFRHSSRNTAMEPLSREELEAFQKLSNEHEPDIQGPLISPKQTTRVVANEYANADPTLAAKTSALAISHPFIRLVRGDGNCAWRAISFGYFETLFNTRNWELVQREYNRISSLNSLLDRMGQQEYLYESFVEATLGILTQIMQAIQNAAPDESFLLEALNAEYTSNSVVAHFRLLTSAWMQLNPMRYQAVLDIPLDQYCASRIEPVSPEIDEVGLQALLDGVIEGSNIAVEVLYLDRSQGAEVTPHLMTSDETTPLIIRLLYRPGHYDLIYPPEREMINPLVQMQYGMTNFVPWDQPALTFEANAHLMAIPGLMTESSYSPSNAIFSPRHTSINTTPEFSRAPMISSSPAMNSPPTSPHPLQPFRTNSLPQKASGGAQIRLNPLVMKQNLSHSLVTTPFKNSPYNQAHFQNQDFEPIRWEPSESQK